ncbi:HNH endonuclease signature motif containing protein [uncultured Microbacterium sp.]|uniref:HNH endonuclease n=1 Tax=uncultured Microbacterium sp. TaxID=191216 RepID=A0A1Y5P9H5_9MICO|nr:HNH endonuclease signature motif containing protein [uncultured Microbacterium sp.]SBS74150.1 HNH endonuclease [uncultured Microbacterium sp.]
MTSTAEALGSDADLATLADLVYEIAGVERRLSLVQIAQLRVLARAGQLAERQAAGSPARVQAHEMAVRSIAAELGGAMRVTDRTVQRRIDEARTVVEDYPAALGAWESGTITRAHVMVIVDAGSVLPAEVRASYESVAIERCRKDTPNRVRAQLEILAQRMHPRSFSERHEAAAAERCVRLTPGRDGMSDLIATLPTVIAEGIHDRLTQQARAIIDTRGERADAERPADVGQTSPSSDDRGEIIATDARTTDQVRADVFADLLLAGTPALDDTRDTTAGPLGAIRARVQVVVPALALSGTNEPCDLVGRSPIDADTARRLAGDAPTWERLVSDPVKGTVLAVDSYRVPMPMRRYLQARDQHCRFPGCRMAAIRCEIDHTHDAALGGKTETRNLGCLCQRHHSMKQFTAWRVRQLTGGVLEWTSPLGTIYREDAPTPAVAFSLDERHLPATEAAPF